MSIPAWLTPGSTIKRWLLVFIVGLLLIVLGVAYLFVDLYRHVTFSGRVSDFVHLVTLQDIPRGVRGVLVLGGGGTAIWLALRHLNKVIVAVMNHPLGNPASTGQTVIGAVQQHRLLLRGPRIVCIGGGTGMSMLLKGLRSYSRNLCVVVTVADDGGSSGRLRRELNILPPGDFRQCIAALADVEPMMTKLLEYRFKNGSGLEGHSFGNLFITAMAEINGGSFEKALAESGRVLAVRGRILPSTFQDVTLAARLRDKSTVSGESSIAKGRSPIESVYLIPNGLEGEHQTFEANPEAIEAIREADVIVVGPGSLYTSIMPNLLVPGIAEAIKESHASLKAFVCNVATEPGETDGYRATDFVHAVERHVDAQLFDCVITNNNHHARQKENFRSQVVLPGERSSLAAGVQLIEYDVVDRQDALRHDPQKLAQLLLRLYDGKQRTPERPAGRRSGAFGRAELAVEELAPEDLAAGQA